MVASMAAATGNNSNLIAGVNWNCRIMGVKVLDASNWGSYSWWASGINWAVANGAKVINLSAGGSSSSASISNAIMNAIAQGVIFVTITHNHGSSSITFPGRMLSCITVGATDSTDVKSSFSNYGPAIDLCAPGRSMCGVGRTGTLLCSWSGTSFAAPLVAGVASLLAGMVPDLNQERVLALLAAGADDQVGTPAQDTPGFDIYHGWGRLNAQATLQLAMARPQAVLSSTHLSLSWPAPENASGNRPYVVDFASSPEGPWSRIDWPTNVTYTATNAVWIDNGTETGSDPHAVDSRYYAVGVTGPR
jgi:subtilisin family serine protease